MSVTLKEIDESWTLTDILKANAWLDMQDDYASAWREIERQA
jgi:hypothetical protein